MLCWIDMYYFIHFQWSVSVSSGHNAREYYKYLYLTFLVQTGLDQGDGELSLSEEREVALQHQHKLLRVPLLECQQQILKTKKQFFSFLISYIYIYYVTSLSGSFKVISTFLWTSSSLETLILLTVWISHKFWGWKWENKFIDIYSLLTR